MIDLLIDLLRESRQRGFLGPGPVERHLDHARAFAVAWGDGPAPSRALDLGAGGGLPGLVLAATSWPTTSWTFLDAQTKRTTFLVEAVAALQLEGRVQVVTERAEVLGHDPDHRGTYDLVTARSFGPPAVTVECAAPLLVVGGRLVVSEPPDAGRTAARWPEEGLSTFAMGPATLVQVEAAEDSVHLAVMELRSTVGPEVPRRVGIPTKRPRF